MIKYPKEKNEEIFKKIQRKNLNLKNRKNRKKLKNNSSSKEKKKIERLQQVIKRQQMHVI